MKTVHSIINASAEKMTAISSETIDLVVTSPPYPMIQMWDESFCTGNPDIKKNLVALNGRAAFELMHQALDKVWDEVIRVLKPGGFACINIGDATRKIGDDFCLYPNHARILHYLIAKGLNVLPDILWRKQTNAPNKFMGSGMLPAGAYVTLEHEYILIVRKGPKRSFHLSKDKKRRRQSAILWEERNLFYSDVWTDLKGTSQDLKSKASRQRSAAFPFELAYRLICMYSLQEDMVLDPFLGTGTTLVAAAATCRNSIGIERDAGLLPVLQAWHKDIVGFANQYNRQRLERHTEFVQGRVKTGKPLKHHNPYYDFPVVTSQETELIFPQLTSKSVDDDTVEITY